MPPAGKSGRVSTPIRHHWTHRRTRGEECAVKIVTFEKRPAIAPAISVRAPQHTHPRKHLIGSVSRKLDLRFLRVALTIYKSTASDGKALIISTQSRRGPTLPISLFMEWRLAGTMCLLAADKASSSRRCGIQRLTCRCRAASPRRIPQHPRQYLQCQCRI